MNKDLVKESILEANTIKTKYPEILHKGIVASDECGAVMLHCTTLQLANATIIR